MQNRVLVAIDMQSPAVWAALYGVQLAARLKSPLALVVIAAADQPQAPEISLAALKEEQRAWLEKFMAQCRQEGVSPEIFFVRGAFLEELPRFLGAQAGVQFIVLGLPRDLKKDQQPLFAALKDLRRSFGGEILLVREKGEIARLSDYPWQNPGRET